MERNFRCRAGEIDLVAFDGPTLVFVEVRSRRGDRAGTPFESVDGRKQARVTRVARHFLAARGLIDRDVRFDVVGSSIRAPRSSTCARSTRAGRVLDIRWPSR